MQPFWRNAIAACIALALLVALGRYAGGYLPRFSAWVEGLGFWAPAVFIAGYVIATVAFVPGSLLTLAAGAMFGVVAGTLYVLIGATIGACAAFLVARHLARDFVARRIRDQRFAAIDRSIAERGLSIVFLLRLSPIFPFNLINYALGVTNVSFKDYTIGCLGMLPGTLLYVYYGKLAGDVATAASGARPDRGPADYAVIILGFVATIAATAIVTKAARKALQERVEGI